jgi:hypothetical protein
MFVWLSVLVVPFTGAWMMWVLWALEISTYFNGVWSMEFEPYMALEKGSNFQPIYLNGRVAPSKCIPLDG